jgi:hypothetical protein
VWNWPIRARRASQLVVCKKYSKINGATIFADYRADHYVSDVIALFSNHLAKSGLKNMNNQPYVGLSQ